MSQIETIMLVTLGFVIAALVALFLSRLVWSFAVTLGKRRTERSAPATIAGLQAERDQLRAEYAMLSRKLELRLDDLKTRLAEQTAEVSRNRNRIDHLIKEVEKRNEVIAERNGQIEQFHEQIEPLEIELATRTQVVQKIKEQLRDRDDELEALEAARSELESQLTKSEHQLASTRDELAKAPVREELTSEAQSAHERLQSQIQELTVLSQQIERQRSDMSLQYDEFAKQQSEASPEPRSGTAKKQPRKSPAKTRKTAKQVKKPTAKVRKATKTAKKPATRKGAAKTAAAIGKMARKTTKYPVDVNVKNIQRRGKNLEQQILDAERDTDQLQSELQKLDKVWAEKIAALDEVTANTAPSASKLDTASGKGAGTADGEPGGKNRQNVISLAARIRALQKKSAEK